MYRYVDIIQIRLHVSVLELSTVSYGMDQRSVLTILIVTDYYYHHHRHLLLEFFLGKNLVDVISKIRAVTML
jgi:hypothetical protein